MTDLKFHLTHEQLIKKTIRCLSEKPSFTEPSIFLFEADGRKYVYKAYKNKYSIAFIFWGRFFLRNEFRKLNALQKINGIPKTYNIISGAGYVMEYLDAKPLSAANICRESKQNKREGYNLYPSFFDEAYSALKSIHSLGIAHCDIRRKNILAGKNGKPFFIDFATAVKVYDDSNFIYKSIFKTLCKIDYVTLFKIKKSFFPEFISPEESAMLNDIPLVLTIGRFFRKFIYRPLKRFFKLFAKKH